MGTEPPVFTGYFTDGERRIDLMLVIQDDGKEEGDKLRIKFLINMMKLGLELELEPGLLKQHLHLIFVKVHAPDFVIEEQGEYFRVRKYFKDSHVEFVNPGNIIIKFIKRLVPLFFNNYEKEWIKIVRRQYPGSMNYSNLERSLIVYRMLLVLPFGDHENFVGLTRLIENKILLDAFALHDGPYFFIPDQNILTQVNGRQILFANWVGGGNFLKTHPVSMIQEYFGERIAFYFAFAEFYIKALAILTIAGNIIIYQGWNDAIAVMTKRIRTMKRTMFDNYCYVTGPPYKFWHYESLSMCPKCLNWRICPFTPYNHHCAEFILKSILNSPKMIQFYALLTLWALVFVLLWKRKEYYFRWLWETDDLALRYTYRPGYKIHFSDIKRSKTTGMWTNNEGIVKKVAKIGLNLIVLGTCICATYPLTIVWANFQFLVIAKSPIIVNRVNLSLYYGIAKTATLYSIMVTIFGKATVLISRLLTRFENHRDQESLDRSIIGKMFLLTFIVTYWYVFFLGFIKGRLYTTPIDLRSFNSPGGLAMMHCGIMNCVDELAVTVVVIAFVKFVIPKGICYMLPMTTDYSQGISTNARIPIWEREYKMPPITEQDIREMHLELTMQFAFITLFGGAFSPISLIIMIANIWDVRYKARLLLTGRRRPLLFRCSGIGTWLTWWEVIAYVAILFNALMCALNTKAIIEYISQLLRYRIGALLDPYYTSALLIRDFLGAPAPIKNHSALYLYKIYTPPNFCIFPGMYEEESGKAEETMFVDYIKYYESIFVIVYELCFIGFITILLYVVPSQPKDIQETLKVEDRIKIQCYIRRKVVL